MVDIVKQMVSDPDNIFKSIGLVPGDGNVGQGHNAVFGKGPCGIKQTKLFNGIYKLEPDFTKRGHFFFPYGVYKNAVPIDIPFGQPDGTIAFTAAMNGCSLQVNRVGGGFTFYHDPLSTSLTGNEPGEIVCRVGPKSYDLLDRGSQMVEESRTSKFGGTYGVGVYCIHLGGKWKVYTSPVAAHYDKKGGYSRAWLFTASITPLMTSFDDG